MIAIFEITFQQIALLSYTVQFGKYGCNFCNAAWQNLPNKYCGHVHTYPYCFHISFLCVLKKTGYKMQWKHYNLANRYKHAKQ